MFSWYESRRNYDQTEGRGPMVSFGYFTDEQLAVKAVKGQGVMGVGDGEVIKVTLTESSPGVLDRSITEVYGYRRDWNGKWGYGWVDNRDAPTNDPEYAEYMRLKEKFSD